MVLKDIRKHHIRVSEILRRMKAIFGDEYAVKEDISRGLKTLAQEQLISSDQFDKLMTMVDNYGETHRSCGQRENWLRNLVSPAKN